MNLDELEIVIDNESGLHLRPATLFVTNASKFKCSILVKNVTRGSGYKNAKSAIEVMTLAVDKGHKISIKTEGEDSKEAIERLKKLITSNFTE